MTAIEISHYCNSYRSANPNDIVVSIGWLDIYFSYRTVVAFRTPEAGLVCSENVWSNTTGRHLNSIQPDKSRRVPYDEFQDQLQAAVGKHV